MGPPPENFSHSTRWGCAILQSSTDNQSWTGVPGAVSRYATPATAPRMLW